MRCLFKSTAFILVPVVVFTVTLPGYAQSKETASVDSVSLILLDDDLDSLHLFQLIDSLLELDLLRASQFSIHLGYVSEVSNAGRTLDVKQYGFNPGITYFHKSGVFADVTGYWNSDLDPHYDLTVVSMGYIGFLTPKLTYNISYDHSFFTDSEVNLDLPEWVVDLLLPPILNNSVSTGIDLDLGGIETGIDYSWLFNQESAHRIHWRLTGDLKKYSWLGADRISFRPAFEMLFGSSDVISVTFSREAFIQNRFPYRINSSNEFGLMNYRFRVPLSITKKRFQFIVEYNYNIPVTLPGEDFDYPNNSFFSMDLYYNFAFGSKKSIFD
ncbi:MAG: hypothetical protein DHS20C17_25360 [Cyclobacteriaceae bacterium]|nr:MAG: hypothetical protein DHS20C17_25360 [Cyclobacteriaceae bacterium]